MFFDSLEFTGREFSWNPDYFSYLNFTDIMKLSKGTNHRLFFQKASLYYTSSVFFFFSSATQQRRQQREEREATKKTENTPDSTA